MPSSMTGFARVDQVTEWGNLVCELKSVNHRFLDLTFRLPDSLRPVEHQLRERIRKQLARGKVECSMSVRVNPDFEASNQFDPQCLENYLTTLVQIERLAPNADSYSSVELLKLPGVLRTSEVGSEELQKLAFSALQQALKNLSESRAEEGAAMAAEIIKRTQRISEITRELREMVPQIRESQQQRLRQRIEDLDIEVNPDRLETELVILAQRMDVDEEIDRLDSHLKKLGELARSDKPVGREMDFLMQELNREANTLGSKSQALEQTNYSVELKVLIEQMREQIQNLE